MSENIPKDPPNPPKEETPPENASPVQFRVADGAQYFDGAVLHGSRDVIAIHPRDFKAKLPRPEAGRDVLIPLDQEGADALKWDEARVKRHWPDGFPDEQEPPPPPEREEDLDDEERRLRASLPPEQRAARAANIAANREGTPQTGQAPSPPEVAPGTTAPTGPATGAPGRAEQVPARAPGNQKR